MGFQEASPANEELALRVAFLVKKSLDIPDPFHLFEEQRGAHPVEILRRCRGARRRGLPFWRAGLVWYLSVLLVEDC